MASLHNISGIDKVLRNRATRDEPGLIRVNKRGDERPESQGKTFGKEFKAGILERDRTEVVRFISPRFLGEKNDIGFVDRPEVRRERVKVNKRGEEGVFD
jgi:hypothetical protein